MKVVGGVVMSVAAPVGVWLLSNGKSPSDMEDVYNDPNSLNNNDIPHIGIEPSTSQNSGPKYINPSTQMSGNISQLNQAANQSSHTNSMLQSIQPTLSKISSMISQFGKLLNR